MPTKHKHRKPGDWKSIEQSRRKIPKEIINGHGCSGIPNIGDVGSAAYRRMQKQKR